MQWGALTGLWPSLQWWPKLLSRLRQVRGWELWSSHLKVVESEYSGMSPCV